MKSSTFFTIITLTLGCLFSQALHSQGFSIASGISYNSIAAGHVKNHDAKPFLRLGYAFKNWDISMGTSGARWDNTIPPKPEKTLAEMQSYYDMAQLQADMSVSYNLINKPFDIFIGTGAVYARSRLSTLGAYTLAEGSDSIIKSAVFTQIYSNVLGGRLFVGTDIPIFRKLFLHGFACYTAVPGESNVVKKLKQL